MKKLLIAVFAVAFAVFFYGLAMAADCTCQCPMCVKGATVEVKNTDKGVTISITSTDPAIIKDIQSKAEKIKASGGCPCMKNCSCAVAKEGVCPMMQGNDQGGTCPKMQSGDCPMMKKQQSGHDQAASGHE